MLYFSGGNTKPTSKPDLYRVVWLRSHTKKLTQKKLALIKTSDI